MKSIIRILFLVFILGAINNAIAQSAKNNETIILQASNATISPIDLKLSEDILRSRLKDIGLNEVELKLIPEKGQISLNILNKHADIPAYLLTQKGEIEFYEVYNREMLSKLFVENKDLFQIINSIEPGIENSSELGCIDQKESINIINKLNSVSGNVKCKFITSYLAINTKKCIYALNAFSDISKSINGSDIEYIHLTNETEKLQEQIEMQFKEGAVAKWSDLTAKNINKGIAVCIDNEVFFAPILRTKIEGGKCVISGDFPTHQLKLFKAIGNSKALPMSFIIIK